MILNDFHVHTTFCDGKDTAEDIVKHAISLGMKKIGFSGHSFTSFDTCYCIGNEQTELYKKTINDLKVKYKDQIEILLGIELDYFSTIDTSDFDYAIGSIHYIKKGDKYYSIDHNIDTFKALVHECFKGDVYAMCESYFEMAGNVLEKTNADVIGHFDLITKFNEKLPLIDVTCPRYVNAYKKAVDKLIKSGKPFEVNTGAISRGYRTTPYPSIDILEYIAKKGGKVIFSSDSHKKETLLNYFNDFEDKVKDLGLEIVSL